MPLRSRSADPKPPGETRLRLLEAASAAFNTDGFHGANSNTIARAAGYAPQTFYRHFDDKIAIFLAVYDRWRTDERDAIRRVAGESADAAAIAAVVLAHHRDWRVFRRSLRTLAAEAPRVAMARAESREDQLRALQRLGTNAGRSRAALIAAVLHIERLCDAAAEGELADLGLGDDDVAALVAQAVLAARGTTATER